MTNEQKLRIQRGVHRPVLKDSTNTHYIFELGFNKNLEEALKNTQKPKLFLTGDAAKESYIKFNEDTTAAELYYPKKYFDEQGIGKNIGISWIHEGGSIDFCSPDIPGTKTNPLASFYWTPSIGSYKQFIKAIPKKTQEKTDSDEIPYSNYNINNINNTTNTTNNFYADTTSKKVEKVEREGLELRVLTEANKTVNPKSPFLGVSGAIQLGKGSVWVGPYATIGFGKETSASSTPIYHENLLNQSLQLSTITEGTRNESSRLSYPIEFGGLFSVGSRNGRVRVNTGCGVVKEAASTSDVLETGHDWISQNGDVVGEKKPYSVNIEKGADSDKYIPTQKIGVDVHPFKNSGFYLGAEAQHRGKFNSKIDKINYNVKAGWRFGGKRK